MKIICIARNYLAHVHELGNAVPGGMVLFLKPASALLTGGMPFHHPDFSQHIDYETEIVLRVSKGGSRIPAKAALSHIDAVTVGIDFTARDLQASQKAKGLPWEIAKSFDSSACLGSWMPISEIPQLEAIGFHLERDGTVVQKGNTKAMTFGFAAIISHASKYFTLERGDVIFTGTPAGIGKIASGETYHGYLNGQQLLACKIQ
ncbi:MAG: fumarylacetoacetate hydrolase family protein [Candidatus Aenigmarchaeota archaeon]|nr:fumarylacetoacetate hydrolase family protein [Candidatus Aenigmarchaeota archaeon]